MGLARRKVIDFFRSWRCPKTLKAGSRAASCRSVNKNLPTVSIVIPARDASTGLPAALESIASQTYPNVIEIVVAAADEKSAGIARRHAAKVVQNPRGSTPAGLNLAISASQGDVVVRCDAYSTLPPQYVERAVETLTRTEADNVGGMQVPQGYAFWERAIAAAMVSPLGAGDARYRLGGDEGPVETVYLGVFKRSALERVGGFDESFSRTQDYELNHRIIESGGVVWFDPQLRVEYRPRGSLGALARQYFDYGKAKRLFARRHPGSLRWRQLGPPGVVVALGVSLLLSIAYPVVSVVPAAYLLGLAGSAAAIAPKTGLSALGVPPALATMHVAWGWGFLTG